MDTTNVLFCWAMFWGGQAVHLLKIFTENETIPDAPSAREWIKKHPWTMAYSVVAGLISFGVLYSMNWLNPIGALTCGYTIDSVMNGFTDRAQQKLAAKDTV